MPLPCALPRTVLNLVAVLAISGLAAAPAAAQIGAAPRSPGGTRVPTLQETMANNLRATTSEQQEFLRRVDQATDEQRLSPQLVLAVMRYSQRRNSAYPFPYFERAIRFEAAKRNVYLPPVAVIASTALPRHR